MTPPVPNPAAGPGTAPPPGTAPAISSADLYAWIAQRRRSQRRAAAVAVVVIAVVVAAVTVYFTAFSQQLVAMNHLRSVGFAVDWDLNWSNVRTGGTTWVAFRPERWSMDLQVASNDLDSLKSLRHVKSLDVSNLIRFRDDDFAVVASLGDLEDLELNRTSESGMDLVMRMPGTGGQGGRPMVLLGDKVLDHVQGLTRLTTLGLAGNQISDAGLEKLANLQSLEVLDLDGTGVTNAGLNALVGLKSLKSLRVENTQVTKRGVARFQQKRPDVEVLFELKPNEDGTAIP